MDDKTGQREVCYSCYRPMSSCMCEHIRSIKTNTKFVILMHPKEFKKTKNNTGHLTHLSLPNSEIHVDIDFTHNTRINKLIDDPTKSCYLLYPSADSLDINRYDINKGSNEIVIFIVDSTWACSRKILRLSQNLKQLQKISFSNEKISQYMIKKQPKESCLSTIESTHCVLEILNTQKYENITQQNLNGLLNPFKEMVIYQLGCLETGKSVRFKKR